ncbi:hypothetical protein SAMN05421647_102400 [Marinobacterium stanieri]|uniref:Uncharacterized protein n=1 Tax=Marinobacterium stanieri TaxID=49186 RepID=A0A1N6QBQ6_9GAMM|nr:hypothetical protein SAMN05421647_102400 [Marinobacterium stanieri]
MNRPTECSLRLLDNVLMLYVGLVNWLMSSVISVILAPVTMLALMLILLSGCVFFEPTPQYLREPVPQTWTDTLVAPSLNGTYGDYIAHCELFVKQCNDDRISVRGWSDEAQDVNDGAPGTPK